MAERKNGKCFPIIKSVCVYWKIIGLCPFVLADDDTGPPSYGGMCYTIILILAYIVCYCYAVAYRVRFILPSETPMIVIADFLAFSTEFFLIILAWLYAVLYHEEIQKILNTFKNIQENSVMLDIGQDFQKIFRTIKIHAIVINVTWLVLYITDHIFLYDAKTSNLEIWIPFNLPRVLTHNVVLMYMGSLWTLKSFFRSLNEKIHKLSKEVTPRLIIPEGNRRSSDNDGIRSFVMPSPLEAYVRMHSNLVDLTKLIVNFFALSITTLLLYQLIIMACDLYVLCLMVNGRTFSTWRNIAVFAQLVLWSLVHFIETLILIALCDSTANEVSDKIFNFIEISYFSDIIPSRQANRTGIVVHTLLVEDRTEKYVDSVQILSLRLLEIHLRIDPYGLFEIRFPVYYKMVGMVVTYITIMMQLDIQELQQHQIQKALL